jgi:DNA-binding SARP family transcriptional activator
MRRAAAMAAPSSASTVLIPVQDWTHVERCDPGTSVGPRTGADGAGQEEGLRGCGVEILVLGSLLVARDGIPAYIPTGYKPRLVLAVLAARAGHTVSTDALIAAVWGDRPPVSARRNLQQYVHQLRAALGTDLLVRHSQGYSVVVGDEVDAVRFRRLTADGDAALTTGDAALASKLLRAGLDLWRGPAFAEFLDCSTVAHKATSLEQLRADTYERWAQAELALGRHAGLATELAELAREHPYREGLRARLMLALYRSGRQVEALETFRQTRSLLRDQLGIEPGHELRRLHEDILRGDPQPVYQPTPLAPSAATRLRPALSRAKSR